jgi:hypothetical protein
MFTVYEGAKQLVVGIEIGVHPVGGRKSICVPPIVASVIGLSKVRDNVKQSRVLSDIKGARLLSQSPYSKSPTPEITGDEAVTVLPVVGPVIEAGNETRLPPVNSK